MPDILWLGLTLSVASPFCCALLMGLLLLARRAWLSERTIYWICNVGLLLSLLGSLLVLRSHGFDTPPVEVNFGRWILIGIYEIPVLFYVDNLGQVFSLLGSVLTLLVARFSQTYLHKEAGFARFFMLLGVFAGGTQLVAFAGILDLLFAGWEAIGICSALFIGYFYEREEPVRSAVRAFSTYRICDAGFLIALVSIHELLNTTSITALSQVNNLPELSVTFIAVMLMIAAFGKSAQLPFSSWLPRAMEGPTPSSALFYGSVSIHVGLFMLLRISPILEAAPVAQAFGIVVGLATAFYAAAVAATHTDAKGALAHATLAQIGLILAEICMGFTTFALIHLVCHALLRVWQYLKAPHTLADSHAFGHETHASPGFLEKYSPRTAEWLYAQAVHRFRLDDRMDTAVAPILKLAASLASWDESLRNKLTWHRGSKP